MTIGIVTALGYALIVQPPFATIERQQVGVRSNVLTGGASVIGSGRVLLLPGLHSLRRYPLADTVYLLESVETDKHSLRSAEKIGISANIRVTYAVDSQQLAARSDELPDDIDAELVAPLLREASERQFAARSVLAILAEQHAELHTSISTEMATGLAAKGLILRKLSIEEIEPPALLADRIYRPDQSARANGAAALQTSEGLAIGAEITLRYALDPQQLAKLNSRPASELEAELLAAMVQGVIYKQFAHYTVHDIFSGKRQELEESIASELAPMLLKDGLLLRSLSMGNIDLPADYRAGMDRLLAAELSTRQMEHTLELKAKQVKETELQAEADKVRRDKAAEAAANEQVIAAKAQEEAMRHVLPFKQKQLEQRRLEAEADKASRISVAEAAADARRLEAAAEADSRRTLADADAYRIEQLGKLSSTQLERDGALISRYPLLIQKTMADKLSDKVSVIIAPPPGDGGFIGNTLLGAKGGGQEGAR
ncbi:MAG: SPFH domain-containing protein [Pseudomarimonas sp.]